jgi:aldose sugar dehydrogenase
MRNFKNKIALIFSTSFIACQTDSNFTTPQTPTNTTPTTPTTTITVPLQTVDGFKVRTVIDNLDVPWETLWGSDNFLWITERKGIVSRINPETGEKKVILTLSDCYQANESGLLGMVFHPDFKTNQQLYIVYTYRNNGQILEKLVRYSYEMGELRSPQVILDKIQGNTTHDGSRLIITADRKLMMTTGDAQNQPSALDKNALTGKTLRMNLDGSVPADNPFPNSLVYSFGHRNAQGLVQLPNGLIYSSEHGPDTDDEINIIEKGGNYGWNQVKGAIDPAEKDFADKNKVIPSIVQWTPTIAPSDMVWYSHDRIPSLKNKLLMTILKDMNLAVFTLSEDGKKIIDAKARFHHTWGRLRDICVSPDGRIFIATNGASWNNIDGGTHKIYELSGE